MNAQLSREEYFKLKECIKKWIISIDKRETLTEEITALNFGLFEPYGIELIGAKRYDSDDDDWACEEDFIPNERVCPNVNVSGNIVWEDFLNIIVRILQELTADLKDLNVLKVEHITTGFCDGDLVVIR